ncbi:hypothetical protein IK146_03005 [Candidatus Saccharibacteria bacterium]|nr:hypothetical protein [Candidatus Saccharibacteria bacterium]
MIVMRNSDQQRTNDISRFIENQLREARNVNSVEQVKCYLSKLDKQPGIYSPFFPEKWAKKPAELLPQKAVDRIEAGKRVLEVLIKEAPTLGIPVLLLPAFDYDDESHHYKSYEVGFNMCGEGGYIKIVPIAFGPLTSDTID